MTALAEAIETTKAIINGVGETALIIALSISAFLCAVDRMLDHMANRREDCK